MNCSSILRSALPVVGVLVFVVACGPRMKPVDYQEPSQDLSASGEGSDDEGASSKSTSSSSDAASSSSSSSSSSSEGGGGASKFVGSCKDKKCGEGCTECAPGDESCNEVLILKQCNLKGDCVPSPAECSTAKKDKGKDKDKDKDKKK